MYSSLFVFFDLINFIPNSNSQCNIDYSNYFQQNNYVLKEKNKALSLDENFVTYDFNIIIKYSNNKVLLKDRLSKNIRTVESELIIILNSKIRGIIGSKKMKEVNKKIIKLAIVEELKKYNLEILKWRKLEILLN
jgi:hypothetical protein